MHCHLNEPPPRPSRSVQEIPKELDDLVVKLMAKSPADRPWDAAAVEQSLLDLRGKAQSDQPIAMVWPIRARRGQPSPRGRGHSAAGTRKKTRKSGALSGLFSGFASRDAQSGGLLSAWPAGACSRPWAWEPP